MPCDREMEGEGMKALVSMAGLAACTWPLASLAQETRVGEPGFESPDATIADAQWLVGQWSGTGIGGAGAHESWLPPSGGTMVGSFVQEEPDGSIMFTEHMYLMEQDGSLVVKLKHFNPDLTGWEDKDGMLTFRLLSIEPCAAYFNALTYRCDGDGGMVVAVRMKSEAPEIKELTFRFERSRQDTSPNHCRDAATTLEMNECYAQVLARADERRATYLAAALEREADNPDLAAMIAASDRAFTAYREAECGAVFDSWKEGTIRGVMWLTCSITMTDQRTHDIWQNWLTYMDSTPPILPEPTRNQ